jgi:hypothetical protein
MLISFSRNAVCSGNEYPVTMSFKCNTWREEIAVFQINVYCKIRCYSFNTMAEAKNRVHLNLL